MKTTEIHIIPTAEVDDHTADPSCVCDPPIHKKVGKCTVYAHPIIYEDTPNEFTLRIEHRKPKAK